MLGLALIAAIATAFVVFCGVELFIMRSSLYEILHRFGVPFASILSLVVIFAFIFNDIVAVLGAGLAILFALLGAGVVYGAKFALNLLEKKLLTPKKTRIEKKVIERVPQSAIIILSILGMLECLLIGVSSGLVFMQGFGSTAMILSAFALFLIPEYAQRAEQFEKSVITQANIKLNLFASLFGLAGGVVLGYFVQAGTSVNVAILLAPIAIAFAKIVEYVLGLILKSR